MEHENRIVSWSFFIILLCVYFMIDFVKVSEAHSKAYMINEAIKNRSILEQGGIGHDACAGILGPNWQNVAKQNSSCPNLVVWVPKKTGFTEFVKVNEESHVEGGFSIAIFCHALQLLSFNIQPIFIPFVNEKGESKGTYNELTQLIKNQTCEAVAEWNQTLLTFIKPFTWRLWITIIGACIFIGIAIAILEYRIGNPKFAIPFYQKLIMVIWFPISTFFFHEGKILNRCSKVVLIMWLSMIFIVVQIFTATLSSWLTLNQLQPSLPSRLDNVGYQDGTFLKDFILQNPNQYRLGNNPVPLKDVEDFRNALSDGSVNVVVDELPYIELFLAKYGSDYMKFGPIQRESGFAFAFPHRSPLVEHFSTAVINVTESKVMMKMMEKYLGFSTAEISLLCGNKKIIPVSTVYSMHL